MADQDCRQRRIVQTNGDLVAGLGRQSLSMRGPQVGLDKDGRPGLPTKKDRSNQRRLGRWSWSPIFVDEGPPGWTRQGWPTRIADKEGSFKPTATWSLVLVANLCR